MKKVIRVGLIILGTCVLIISPFLLWLFMPNIEAEFALLRLRSVDESTRITTKSSSSINTFNDGVSSDFIKRYYNRAAEILSDKSPKTQTYKSTDPNNWGDVITVLQNESGYIAVSAGVGNDSDSLGISYIPGTFDTSNMELLSDYHAPKGLLRVDWPEPPPPPP
ncbi:MAG: hypothetical protein ACSHYF_08975 [Verrucomicrobiaceae bacterium]